MGRRLSTISARTNGEKNPIQLFFCFVIPYNKNNENELHSVNYCSLSGGQKDEADKGFDKSRSFKAEHKKFKIIDQRRNFIDGGIRQGSDTPSSWFGSCALTTHDGGIISER